MDKISLGSQKLSAKLRRSGSTFSLLVNDEIFDGDFSRNSKGIIQLTIDGKRFVGFSERSGNEIFVFVNGVNYVLRKESSSVKQSTFDEESDDIILSPITGKLLDKKVEKGNEVKKGDVVVILEAIKMEHRLKAPRDGVITKLTTTNVGGQIKEGELMFELEAE